ncbi:MAG: M24 family metallopeptidase [Actinomycetes bacterium]
MLSPIDTIEERLTEVDTKLERVRRWLGETGRVAVLLASQSDFAWITAGADSRVAVDARDGVGAVLVTNASAYLLTSNIELPRLLDEEVGGLPLEPVVYPWYEPDGVSAMLGKLADLSHTVSDTGAFGLAAVDAEFAPLRYTLLEPEVRRFRALGADAAQAVEVACRAARPGDTELDIAAAVAAECGRRNIVPLVDLVAADERIGRYRHPLPTRTRVRHTLLVALTGRRHGLHASLTRMVSFGSPDDDLAARHGAVLRVDALVNLQSRPGAQLSDVLAAAADQYATEGFPGEWERHHQGGLTGYAGREIFATPRARHRLEPWQATAWNPSITRVKSEDTVLVTLDGPEVLTRTDGWPQVRVEHPAGSLERPALLRQS